MCFVFVFVLVLCYDVNKWNENEMKNEIFSIFLNSWNFLKLFNFPKITQKQSEFPGIREVSCKVKRCKYKLNEELRGKQNL